MSNSTRRSLVSGMAAVTLLAPLAAHAAPGADQALLDLAARVPDLKARIAAAQKEEARTEQLAWAARELNRPLLTPADREIFNCFEGGATRWDLETFKRITWDRPKGTYQHCSAWYARLAELAPVMNGLIEADKKSDRECGHAAAEELVTALWQEAIDLVREMDAIPATGMPGLLAKARVAQWHLGCELINDEDEDADHKVTYTIVRDLLAMGAAHG